MNIDDSTATRHTRSESMQQHSTPNSSTLITTARSSSQRSSNSGSSRRSFLSPSSPVFTRDWPSKLTLNYRWIVLFLNCVLLIGNYYAYDLPSALAPMLRDFLAMPEENFDYLLGLFYSVYSFPNTILPFLSGHVIETFGSKKVLLVLSTLVCIGQLLFTFGVTFQTPWLMVFGRLVFGLGGESLGVVQSCVITKWFQRKELAFALGLNLAIPRIGTVLNAMISPYIATQFGISKGVPLAVWIGFSMTCMSFIGALLLTFVFGCDPPPDDDESDSVIDESAVQEALEYAVSQRRTNTLDETSQAQFSSPTTSKYSSVIGTPQLGYRKRLQFVDSVRGSIHSGRIGSTITREPVSIQQAEPTPKTWFATIKEHYESTKALPTSFWLLCPIVILTYGTIVPFNNIIIDFLRKKWLGGDSQTAGQMMSIPDTVCAILVSPMGYLVDRTGHRASYVIVSCVLIAIVHLMLGFSPPSDKDHWLMPILPLVLLGISYSIYGVAYWSSISCIFTDYGESEENETPIENNEPELDNADEASSLLPRSHNIRNSSRPIYIVSPGASPATTRVQYSALPKRPGSAISSGRLSTTSLPLLAATRTLPVVRASGAVDRKLASGFSLTTENSPSAFRKNIARTELPASPDAILSTHEDSPTEEDTHEDVSGQLAIAYGISTSAMNISLTIVPLVVAAIKRFFSESEVYVALEVFFASEALLAAFFGCLLLWVDLKYFEGKRLEASHWMPLSDDD